MWTMELITAKQLESVNIDTEYAIDQAEKMQEISDKDNKLRETAESFIFGQAKLYVVEKRNKTLKNNELVHNGPVFKERTWNSRPLNAAAVQELSQINGGRLYPTLQEFAIVIAVSESLLQGIEVAPYNSHEFPAITFKENVPGEIHIINGHHRIEALITNQKYLLTQAMSYRASSMGKLFKTGSDADTPAILEARDKLAIVERKLFEVGAWGAIILNYGKCNLLFI